MLGHWYTQVLLFSIHNPIPAVMHHGHAVSAINVLFHSVILILVTPLIRFIRSVSSVAILHTFSLVFLPRDATHNADRCKVSLCLAVTLKYCVVYCVV